MLHNHRSVMLLTSQQELGDLVKVTSVALCLNISLNEDCSPCHDLYKTILHPANNGFSLFFSSTTIYMYDLNARGQKNLVSAVTLSAPTRPSTACLLRAFGHQSDLPALRVIVLWKSCPSVTFFPFCILCLHFGPFLIHEGTSCTMHLSTEQNAATSLPVISVSSCYFLLKSLSGEKERKMLLGDLEYPVGHDA